MENALQTVSGMVSELWDWTVHLNGGLQIALALVSCVLAGVCAIVGRRMQQPSMMETTGGTAMKTVIAIVAYVLGVVFTLVMLFAIAAVFAPLLGFAQL
ncbi:hypothetical protein BLEM_2074 [Bifidobacterium lemurum]|uniref:DUF4190 domain-containing protein n=1 Tax=Bifidobacterium lemurum TaxID=1603886 RepID=A0A261FL64_9BIFI|nr:hypothetical protein [Bifidobacterium lemurum]OZG59899.1 hypothetical protein BLEM_2074 [Bifidobacterium lemurum]QOL33925.1 hypothetical protein BL8807_09195 [Bifidobacterium lemurum]